MMMRILAGLALAAGLGACTYGSEVDMAPHSVRPWFSPVEPGRYCPVDLEDGAPMVGAGEDCGFIEWDARTRQIVMREPPSEEGEDEEEPDTAALASLGGGLYLIQEEDPDDTPRFSILTVLIRKQGFAAVDAIGAKPWRELAARHPKVGLSPQQGDRMAYIASGQRSHIGALLRDASALSLAAEIAKDDALDMVVLERGDALTPHPPTPEQARTIAELQRMAAALARRAPGGVEIP